MSWLITHKANRPLRPKFLFLFTFAASLLGYASIPVLVSVLATRVEHLRGDYDMAVEIFGDHSSWLAVRDRLRRSLAGNNGAMIGRKAQILYDATIFALDITVYKQIIYFWVNSSLRLSALLCLVPADFTYMFGSSWVRIQISRSRCDASGKGKIEDRYLPSHLVDPIKSLLPLSMSRVLTILWYVNKKFYESQNLDPSSHNLQRYTGHSAKRTFAAAVRCFLQSQGVETSQPMLPAPILARVNLCGGWKPKSREFWEYSEDWQMLVGRTLIVDGVILSWILNGFYGPPGVAL